MKQKIKKHVTMFCLVVLLIIITITNVFALGIAPSKKIIEYDNQEHTISVMIINNEEKNMKIALSVQGPLSEYVTIDEQVLDISSTELEKKFTYKFQLPYGMETGTQTINIVASEIGDATNTNTINGLLTLTHQLQINIPYARKQLEGYISVSTTKVGDFSTIRLILKNNGIEDIKTINGILKILDKNNNTIYTDNIEEQQDILVGSKINIDNQIRLENVGEYTLEYNLRYDEKEIVIRQDFNFGEYTIAVLNTSVNNFKLGTIAKFDIKLENEWNNAIDNVYSELTIKDKNGTIIGQTNTAKSRIDPGNNDIIMYWDTVNVTAGEYLLNLKIYSDEKILTYEYNSIITDTKIEINPKIIAQYINKKDNSKLKPYDIVVILISFGILITLILLKNKKKK